jgi:hypothetical protein
MCSAFYILWFNLYTTLTSIRILAAKFIIINH